MSPCVNRFGVYEMHVKREIYTENGKKGGEGSFFSAVLAKI